MRLPLLFINLALFSLVFATPTPAFGPATYTGPIFSDNNALIYDVTVCNNVTGVCNAFPVTCHAVADSDDIYSFTATVDPMTGDSTFTCYYAPPGDNDPTHRTIMTDPDTGLPNITKCGESCFKCFDVSGENGDLKFSGEYAELLVKYVQCANGSSSDEAEKDYSNYSYE
ncbi:hypothetical protein BGZ83_002100 [Gryganskiella cystojenkinii]|nr:hypothetical protein BGZ83_002100 [Gryganskiella cystojenkinii]